jgi:hypothetical protein
MPEPDRIRRSSVIALTAISACFLVLALSSWSRDEHASQRRNELISWAALTSPLPVTADEASRKHTAQALEAREQELAQKLYAALRSETEVFANVPKYCMIISNALLSFALLCLIN